MHTVLHVLWMVLVTLGALVGIVGVLVIVAGAIMLANDEASGDNPFE